MLFVVPVDGRLFLLGLLGDWRRVLLCPTQRDLLLHIFLVPLVLGEGTTLHLLAVPHPRQGP
jgi:hypothetical protein